MNPYKKHRQNLNVSQTELGRQLGVSRSSIVALEAGTYFEPPEWALDYFGYDTEESYIEFQNQARTEFPRILGDFSPTPYSQHPFTSWRLSANRSVYELSRHLCINLSILVNFELPPTARKSYKKVPNPLLEVLRINGYLQSELNTFAHYYLDYRRDYRRVSEYA